MYVKVEEINDVDGFLTYPIDTSVWTPLDGVDGVYYMEVDYTAADTEYNVLTNKQVTVKTDVEMDDMNALTEATRPQLKFTAYAIQQLGSANAAEAWAKIGN